MRANYVPGIDLLRFFAAVLVALLHLWGSPTAGGGFVNFAASLVTKNDPFINQGHPAIAFTGALGVQIFFTISGFVISYSAFACRGASDFAVHRFLRLAPTLWICTFLSLVISVGTGFYEPIDAAARALRSLVLSPIGAHIDDVIWTLVLELVFYGSVTILLITNRIDRLGTLSAILAAMSLVYWSTYFCSGCDLNTDSMACAVLLRPVIQKASSILLFQHGCFFALGVTSWRIWVQKSMRFHEVLQLALAVPACLLQLTWFSQYFSVHYGQFGAAREPTLVVLLWLASMALFGLCCWKNDLISDLLDRMALLSSVRLIGLATYPLYLTHVFFGGLAAGLCAGIGVPTGTSAVIGILAATLLSCLIARWIEPWVRSTTKAFLFRRLSAKLA